MLSELGRVLLVGVFLLYPIFRPAQLNGQDVPSLRTQSNVVFVPTLVKDRAGKPVFGLQ